MDQQFVQTLWLTLRLALSTTIILLVIGLPFAYWMAYTKVRIKPLIEALVSMPMVLPPSVIGYYMLVIYSPRNWFGDWLGRVFDVRLAFSFEGVLIASVIFSLPFMIQPLHNGLRALPDSLREASYTLGKTKAITFFRVLLPNIKTIGYYGGCPHFCPQHWRIRHRVDGWRKHARQNAGGIHCHLRRGPVAQFRSSQPLCLNPVPGVADPADHHLQHQ